MTNGYVKDENSEPNAPLPHDEYYCDRCNATMTLNDSFCPACGLSADEELTSNSSNQAQTQEYRIKDEAKNAKPDRTFGNILFMVIGASIGLAIMKAMGLGGGIPGGLFALGGAVLGEAIYRAIFSKVK